MKENRGDVAPKQGMNRDASSFDLQKGEYRFALNANFHDEHGNGVANIQNEPSNVRCSGFKDGFRVIGHKYVMNKEMTLFFLTNPTTGYSEIGYINVNFETPNLTPQETTDEDGDLKVVLETPLQDTPQVAMCSYVTLISDECDNENSAFNKCLNFHIDFPIRESSIIIKQERIGTVLYFSDDRNPQRYLKLDKLGEYYLNRDDCGEDEETCFQCEKMRIFPLYTTPCLKPTIMSNGGNLSMGVYEILISLTDSLGNEMTPYYSLTNPIPIFDENNKVLDQTLLGSSTSFAIDLSVNGVDGKFGFYKIVVLYRNGLNGAQTNYVYGVYPYSQTKVSVYDLSGKQKIDLQDILYRTPTWERARGLADNSGYLYHYGLTHKRIINLQQVVNLMGAFVKWETVDAPESLYKDGVFVSLYEGYMRWETYPLSIKFISDDGYDFPLFPFIARPHISGEKDSIKDFNSNDKVNAESVLLYNKSCKSNERNERWQFFDTSKIDEETILCPDVSEGDTITFTEEKEFYCELTDSNGNYIEVEELDDSCFDFDSSLPIEYYINSNLDEIKDIPYDSDNPCNGYTIGQIIDSADEYPSCTPSVGDNCGELTLVSEELFVIKVDGQSETEISKAIEQYTRNEIPYSCSTIFEPDKDGNSPVEFNSFQNKYMENSEVVYKRNEPVNSSCSDASIISDSIGGQYYLDNDGGTLNSLKSSKNVSKVGSFKVIRLDGTSGGGSIQIDTTYYAVTFTDNLETTALNFEAANASSIMTNHGISCYGNSRGEIVLYKEIDETSFVTVSFTGSSGDLSGAVDIRYFTNKLHKNAIWFEADFYEDPMRVIDVSQTRCNDGDDNSFNAVRVSVFKSCSDSTAISVYTTIVKNLERSELDSIFLIYKSDFSNGKAYIAIDSPIRRRSVGGSTKYTLMPPCGCFSVYNREPELSRRVSFEKMTFGKRQKYKSECEYTKVLPNDCNPAPRQRGLFSYVESTEKYPCNKYLWDSSELKVPINLIPSSIKDDFEDYYVLSDDGVNYTLSSEANFMDKPIRHYRFPSSLKVPFMSGEETFGNIQSSRIYPIGFYISNEVINAFLDVAVANGLLTVKERNSIKRYEIFRGSRINNASIIAKGLLFDVYRYVDVNNNNEPVCYPNYPLNSLGDDQFNIVPHLYNSMGNELFTFHSPDTSFEKPTLPSEMMIEGYSYGISRTYFDEVEDHPKYVVLAQGSFITANILSGVEVGLDVAIQILQITRETFASGTYGGLALNIPILALSIASIGIQALTTQRKKALEWEEIFYNIGKPNNFAYYGVSIGEYGAFKPNETPDSILRGLPIVSYNPSGKWIYRDETLLTQPMYNFNNMDREDSVFIKSNQFVRYSANYINIDKVGNAFSSRRTYDGIGKSQGLIGHCASPYISLISYKPSQYGTINSIEWIYTGNCGNLGEMDNCMPIFGGDTYISRFSVKRKVPFFNTTAMGQASMTPFKYSDYFNINPHKLDDKAKNAAPRFYLDYRINEDKVAILLIPDSKSVYNLDGQKNAGFYEKPPAKFYLYYYGIPYFLVESPINLNYRYAYRNDEDDFYPNVGDVIKWTQQRKVPIEVGNRYYYNEVYSYEHTKYPYLTLPENYDPINYDKINSYEDAVIYSEQDSDGGDLIDDWLIYKPNNLFHFDSEFGGLTMIKGIESEQMLGIFRNGFSVFGAVDVLRDRLDPTQKRMGNNGLFAGRTVSFNKTNLGYAGSQHAQVLSTEFGHFWVDAQRGKVFQFTGSQAPNEISKSQGNKLNQGLEKWFKEQLPFKILKYFPNIEWKDLDNNYNGLGIVLGWDDRLKRVFLTKRDWTPKDNVCFSSGKFRNSNVDDYSAFIAEKENQGFTFVGVQDCRLVFDTDRSGRVDFALDEVEIGDVKFFNDCSFTVAYSPIMGSWISYYSFHPDYFISYNTYFQTGLNKPKDEDEFGLWSHYPFMSSYQVFYGKLYPFVIEYVCPTTFSNNVFSYLDYYLDVRKYYDKHNYSNVVGESFNKAIIYNDQQNTGLLELIVQNNNDLRQNLIYPKHNNNSIEILQTEINGKFSFNHIYNAIKKERAGLPIFKYDINNINKTLDDRLLDYIYQHKDRLRGDYFTVRLINDKESRFKYLFRISLDTKNSYYQ